MEQTPLMAACQAHHFQGKTQYAEVIAFLLESGGDPLRALRSSTNARILLTPLDFVVQSMDSKVSAKCSTGCIYLRPYPKIMLTKSSGMSSTSLPLLAQEDP
eukprot:7601442-Pyramimonas_sp.AAC.1